MSTMTYRHETQLRFSRSITPEEFVDTLAASALRHRAVHHPYLQGFRDGTFSDTRWALRDFAKQYSGYSQAFPQYLTAVASRLTIPWQRKALMQNLLEESGDYGAEDLAQLAEIGVRSEWVVGIPHPQLFARFARALGVDTTGVEHQMVGRWRDMFLSTLTNGSPAEAVGALGLGTENIVSTIYQPFVSACAQLTNLEPKDTVFFPLHTGIDDEHQETLQRIATDFAQTPEGRVGLHRGMTKALVSRAAFWDWMLERATG
jgi:pyrroloquinoline quinone (PQQ) biosynthesis protein C